MNAPSQPSISVVIPCYNGEAFLRATLASACGQTYPPLEVLVVDDGSTDESASIAEGFGPPVRVIRQENQGESVARNRGMDEARGDWIAFLDADDLWAPNKLERQLEFIQPGVVCIQTDVYYFGTEEFVQRLSARQRWDRLTVDDLAVYWNLNTSSMIVPRSIEARFPAWTSYAEDLIFLLDLLAEGAVRVVPEPLTGYRRHSLAQAARGDVEIHWHESVTEWVRRHRSQLTDRQVRRITHRWNRRLVDAALIACQRRDWRSFRAVLEHIDNPVLFSTLAIPRGCYGLLRLAGRKVFGNPYTLSRDPALLARLRKTFDIDRKSDA